MQTTVIELVEVKEVVVVEVTEVTVEVENNRSFRTLGARLWINVSNDTDDSA